MPIFNEEQNNNNGFFAFSLIDIISLIIGLQNMQLNISGNDLDKQTKTILDDLHNYLGKQEEHLALQDEHLHNQDIRIAQLEKMLIENIGLLNKE